MQARDYAPFLSHTTDYARPLVKRWTKGPWQVAKTLRAMVKASSNFKVVTASLGRTMRAYRELLDRQVWAIKIDPEHLSWAEQQLYVSSGPKLCWSEE